MQPLSHWPDAQAAAVHTVLSDLDDTISSHGVVTAQAYAALEALRNSGVRVILVSGRPAGWCDHIARMWPVDAIVGENGACAFWFDAPQRKLRSLHVLDASERAALPARLAAVRERILREVPGCAVASDQFCRLYDLAIDFCEDVAPLPEAAVQRITMLMREAGMTATVSSIHVNGWFGQWDKLSTVRRLLRERWHEDLDTVAAACVYAGDSPNDEPMFAALPLSVGVANIAPFVAQMSSLPRYVTQGAGGAGFAELADRILRARPAG